MNGKIHQRIITNYFLTFKNLQKNKENLLKFIKKKNKSR